MLVANTRKAEKLCSMNRTMLAYFVNWMEALSLFGVIEVSMNNATFLFQDDDIARAFQYYIDRGRLIFTHYPVIHERWTRSRKYDDDASESVNKLTTGDCFYRNIKRYWFTLIIDIDELPVPQKRDTYTQVIEDLISKYPRGVEEYTIAISSIFDVCVADLKNIT